MTKTDGKPEKLKKLKPLIEFNNGPPTYVLMRPDEIAIDRQYQRTLKPHDIKAMISSWDWALFGVLIVSKRENETVWCVDGQHRLTALKEMGYSLATVPCIMLKLSQAEEARVFGELQSKRRGLGIKDRYRAGLMAGDPVWTLIRDTMASHGRTSVSGHGTSTSFSGLALLHRIASADPGRFVSTVSWAHRIAADGAIASETIKGVSGILVICKRHNVDPTNGLNRLVEWGQMRLIDETRKMANRNGTTVAREVNHVFRFYANKYPTTGRGVKRGTNSYIPIGMEE